MRLRNLISTFTDEKAYTAFELLVHELNDEDEEWRYVVTPFFRSSDYLVSDKGRVLSLPRYRSYEKGHRSKVAYRSFLPGGLMRPGAQASGHQTITLSHEKKKFRTHVHRLVAWTFLGPQPPEHHVRHLDGRPDNNRLENLAYSLPWESIPGSIDPVSSTGGTAIVVGSALEDRLSEAIAGKGDALAVLQEIRLLLEERRAQAQSQSPELISETHP